MSELIAALTRAANAVADYYQSKTADGDKGTTSAPSQETGADAAPTKKTRGHKKTEAAAATDVGLDAPAPKADKKKETGMSEEESAKAVTDTAKLLVSKFNKPTAPDNKPEGFHIAKKLLIEGFKVGRLSDLSHEQRIDFVKQVKEILLNGVPSAV